MARNERNYRGYRVWRLVSGDLRILAARETRRDLAHIPPPRGVVIRGHDVAAIETIDALWAGDPDPLRPFLGYAGNGDELAAWVAAADASAQCLWSAREVRRVTLRHQAIPHRPGVTVTVEAIELVGGRVRVEGTWRVGERLVRRVAWNPDNWEERTLEDRKSLAHIAGLSFF